jgi:hypothetical protein
MRSGWSVIRSTALVGTLILAGCNVDQKYHLAPPDPTLTYPTFRPSEPNPPEPVLSSDQVKADTARMEATGGRLNKIPPARIGKAKPKQQQ